MAFGSHARHFAGRPVVDVPADGPLPTVDGPVSWRIAHWHFDDETTENSLSAEFRDAFDRFVAQAGPSVESLVVGSWGYAAFHPAPIAQLCAAASRLPALRALFLGDITSEECEVSWMKVGDVSALLTAYPALEVLRVRGGEGFAFSPRAARAAAGAGGGERRAVPGVRRRGARLRPARADRPGAVARHLRLRRRRAGRRPRPAAGRRAASRSCASSACATRRSPTTSPRRWRPRRWWPGCDAGPVDGHARRRGRGGPAGRPAADPPGGAGPVPPLPDRGDRPRRWSPRCRASRWTSPTRRSPRSTTARATATRRCRSDMRLTVVGNPGNRRVGLFTRAVLAAGLPRPQVLPWVDVLAGAAPPGAGALVRIDSPGEDAEVDRLLRRCRRAGAARRADRRWPTRTPGCCGAWTGSPPAARSCSTTRRTSRCCATSGAATPGCQPPGCRCRPRCPRCTGGRELRAAMAAARWSRVFVKPAHGSSASGVVALAVARAAGAGGHHDRGGRRTGCSTRCGRAATPTRPRSPRIVDRLAADGLHVERWLPKAGLGDRVVDLRVVVVAGRPTHAVVRAARGPLTNLHLGNARGDLAELRAAAGPAAWAAAMRDVRAGGRAVSPRSLQVGIDLMFLRRLAAPRGGRGQRLRRPAAGAPHRRPGHLRRAGARPDRRPVGPLAVGCRPDAAGRRRGTARRRGRAGGARVRSLIGSHDLLLVTLDTLRYDVAAELAARPGARRTWRAALPGGRWERRHTPGSFTYAAHHAFFAGFLPTPAAPGPAPAAVRGARSPAARRPAPAPACSTRPTSSPALGRRRLPHGLHRRRRLLQQAEPARAGAAGPVRREPLGAGARRHRSRTRRENQVDRAGRGRCRGCRPAARCSCSSTSPRCTSPTGSTCRARAERRRGRHAAALEYVDGHLGRLFAAAQRRAPAVFAIVCSDHGTAYGEDGYTGHRLGHGWSGPCRTPSSSCDREARVTQHRHDASTARRTRSTLYAYPHKTAYRPLRPPPAAARTCGRASAATRSSSTCTSRSARCAAASATCSPAPNPPTSLVGALPGRRCDRQAERGRATRSGDGPVRPAGDRRRHADLPDRRRAGRAVRHRRAAHGRRPARRSRSRWRPRPATATPDRLAVLRERGADRSASACRASSTPRPAPPAGRSAAPRSRRRSAAIREPASRCSTST